MDKDRNARCVAFTVPATGRRYYIYPEDWEAIQTHMAIAEAARAKLGATDRDAKK